MHIQCKSVQCTLHVNVMNSNHCTLNVHYYCYVDRSLVNVYSYYLVVKNVSCCCVHGSWLYSNHQSHSICIQWRIDQSQQQQLTLTHGMRYDNCYNNTIHSTNYWLSLDYWHDGSLSHHNPSCYPTVHPLSLLLLAYHDNNI